MNLIKEAARNDLVDTKELAEHLPDIVEKHMNGKEIVSTWELCE